MSSGFGYNGQQLLLMFTLSTLGWVLIAVSRLGRERMETGWLAMGLLTALTAAAPMLFADPDELVLVLNLSSRDVLLWSLYAALATMATGVILGILAFLLRRPLFRPGLWSRRRSKLAVSTSTIALWTVGILIYALTGQPGLHGDRVLVILADQADVSPAVTIGDYAQRRQFVYDALVRHAEGTQGDIRAVLDRLGISYTSYYLVNAIEVEAGPVLRLWLSARPDVDRILHSPVLRPLYAPMPAARGSASAPSAPQWNLTSIGADRVWREFDVRGEGIVVGQSDSGVQWDHPELASAYRGKDGTHDYNWYDPWNHSAEPHDINGHGTHTLGSVLGETVGVAPGATWYGCSNLARNLANPALYLECMQFMLAPFPLEGDPFTDGRPDLGAHVINNSWGCPDLEGCDPNALVHAVRALRASGTFVVTAAGNDGPACETVFSPIALYDESFSVGALTSSGELALFSSRGPVMADGSGRIKPDIAAPGVDVLSAYPGNTYERVDGTSMAGPHVVGVVALVWSANPSLIGDIEQTEQILTDTARPYDYDRSGYPNCAGDGTLPNNAVGHGSVDAYAAVRRALEIGLGR
jgi:subtilisin family serine protease